LKWEVGSEKMEPEEHSDWPTAIVTIARGIAPGQRTPIPGALPQAMMNIAFGEKRPRTVLQSNSLRRALPPSTPLRRSLKWEVGRVKREGDEHTDWPMANVTIARGITPGKRSTSSAFRVLGCRWS
jgi:hypothetical protein